MKMIRKKLDANREHKLSLDYRVVEKIASAFIERWHIDEEIELWLESELRARINWVTVSKNIVGGKRKYQPQFGHELFTNLQKKVQDTYDNYKIKEINYLTEKEGQQQSAHFKLIFENVMDPIPLTMFEDGIQRVTLVSYHYLLKV